MPHHGEVNGDIYSPRSQFYQGPYGRMFRNLPPHVPTIDLLELIDWNSVDGLPDPVVEKLAKILSEVDLRFSQRLEPILRERSQARVSEIERSILTEIEKSLQTEETSRRSVLQPLINIWLTVEGLPESTAKEIRMALAETDPTEVNQEFKAERKKKLTEVILERLGDEVDMVEQKILEEISEVIQALSVEVESQDSLTEKEIQLRLLAHLGLSPFKVAPNPESSLFKGEQKKLLTELEDILKISEPTMKQKSLDGYRKKVNEMLRGEAEVKISSREEIFLGEIQTALEETEAGREAALKLLARTMLDKDDQSEDPAGDNDDIPAGYTYFIQYITHDITFDPTSSLMRFNDPNKLRNFRTPRLDLDSLYGRGPIDSPFMYDHDPENSNTKYYLLVGKNGREGREDDLPRNCQERALIGDPRNDENIIISQLHLAFIKFHNIILSDLINQGLTGEQAFREAQRLVRWHYQWVILHDFLPRFVDQDILTDILSTSESPDLRYYDWRNQPFIPVEFSVAAFRFGHSMIRSRYTLNSMNAQNLPIIPSSTDMGPLEHLLGFRQLPPGWTIQWNHFLQISDHTSLQKSRQIDINLSSKLSQLPFSLGGPAGRSLILQDLLRGYKMDLPSGQAVARALGVHPLDGPETPLLYYILKEAMDKRAGRKLGPVGGRIVADVIIGLLSGDPHSFLNVAPKWQPTCSSLGSRFELRDILHHAKMPLTEQAVKKIINT